VKGKIYVYFRAPGGRYLPLPSDENSLEFETAYQRYLHEVTRGAAQPQAECEKPEKRKKPAQDSINAAVDVYMASWRYQKKLKPGSQRDYRFKLEQIRADLGSAKLCDLDSDALDLHCEDVAFRRGSSTADRHAAILSLIWQVCYKHKQFNLKGKTNPALGFEKRHYTKQPHRPWSEDAEERFVQTAPNNLQLAVLLLRYLGPRGGDAVALEWAQYDVEGFTFAPEKTDDGSEPDYFKCPQALREALDIAPRYEGVPTILVNKFKKPWANAECLSKAIRDHLIKIGLAARHTKTLSMHGLRKTMARDSAFAGNNIEDVQSQGGWKTAKMAAYYVGQAGRKRRNAEAVARVDAYDAQREAVRVQAKRAGLKVVG
jgi:integrase